MGKATYMIDGKEMTVQEIADMLGITERAITVRKCNMGGISYQKLVDMYRENQFGNRQDRWPRHMVDGRWMTQAEAAALVGVRVHSMQEWRRLHRQHDGSPSTVQEAVDYFRQYQTGERKRYRGSVARRQNVHGKKMTVKEAAAKYNTTYNALLMSMRNYGRTLQQAVDHIEETRRKNAEAAIMKILMG